MGEGVGGTRGGAEGGLGGQAGAGGQRGKCFRVAVKIMLHRALEQCDACTHARH